MSQKSLEGKISNVGEFPFGIAMRADFLNQFFFFDGGSLGKMTGSKKELVKVEIIVEVVKSVV